MRNRTPKLILQGNQRKAKKWIPWAMKALTRIKNLTVEGTANKVLRPVTGVAVHVRSVNDIDRIRIAVAQGGCEISFTHEAAGLVVQFTSKLKRGANEIFWDFGDGGYKHTTEESSTTNPVHIYENPGTYIVKATGIEFDEELSVSEPSVLLIVSHEIKEGGTTSSHAAAYALFNSASWMPESSPGNTDYVSSYASGLWRTIAERTTVNIPLQDISSYSSVINKRSLIWLRGLHRTWRELFGVPISTAPVWEKLSGSDLSLPIRKDNNVDFLQITPIDNSLPMVETIVRLIDANGYPILPNPFPGAQVGWTVDQIGSFANIIVRPYKCISSKTKTITVT